MKSNQNSTNFFDDLLIAFAIGGFMWAINVHTKNKQLKQQLYQKNRDYYTLMAEYLRGQEQIPKAIKDQLLHLRSEYTGLNDDIAYKLQTVIELIQEHKDEIAIEKLASIIENLLKERFQQEKSSTRTPTFHNLLQKAKELHWINADIYYLTLFVKNKRNQEAHLLNANFSINEKQIAFLSSIEIIYQLAGFKNNRL